jgi:hypothetical protein
VTGTTIINLVVHEFKFSAGSSSHIQVTEVRQSSVTLSFLVFYMLCTVVMEFP